MFEWSEEQRMIRDAVRQFVEAEIATHRDEGMQTLETSLARLIDDGVITEATAIAVSLHPREITQRRSPSPQVADAVEMQRRLRLRR